jgi:nucleoside-diphosphate-sugar epimerase
MRIVITGGAGFLGVRLPAPSCRANVDRCPRCGAAFASSCSSTSFHRRISATARARPTGDLADPAVAPPRRDTDTVFHLAAVVSAQADFDIGMRVNPTRHALLEVPRLAAPPKFVFASSLAVFGGPLPDPVPDDAPLTPQASYGTQKAIGELLVYDMTRKGFIDGRSLRLPTVTVRPGKPNKAASSFASGIIREPLSGVDAICPVARATRMWVTSPRTVIANIIKGHEAPASAFAHTRSVNVPGILVPVEGWSRRCARRRRRRGGSGEVATDPRSTRSSHGRRISAPGSGPRSHDERYGFRGASSARTSRTTCRSLSESATEGRSPAPRPRALEESRARVFQSCGVRQDLPEAPASGTSVVEAENVTRDGTKRYAFRELRLRVRHEGMQHLGARARSRFVAEQPRTRLRQEIGIVIGDAAEHHAVDVRKLALDRVPVSETAVQHDGQRREIALQLAHDFVAQWRHLAILLGRQLDRIVRMDHEHIAAGGGGADEVANEGMAS